MRKEIESLKKHLIENGYGDTGIFSLLEISSNGDKKLDLLTKKIVKKIEEIAESKPETQKYFNAVDNRLLEIIGEEFVYIKNNTEQLKQEINAMYCILRNTGILCKQSTDELNIDENSAPTGHYKKTNENAMALCKEADSLI